MGLDATPAAQAIALLAPPEMFDVDVLQGSLLQTVSGDFFR